MLYSIYDNDELCRLTVYYVDQKEDLRYTVALQHSTVLSLHTQPVHSSSLTRQAGNALAMHMFIWFMRFMSTAMPTQCFR